MFQPRAKRAEIAGNVIDLDLVEPSRTIPYTRHRAHSLWINYFSSYADNSKFHASCVPNASTPSGVEGAPGRLISVCDRARTL